MTPQSAKLEAIGLRKVFAGRRGREIVAIEEISLAIADREFVCIVGASGCGKSTLLRLVAGLEEPSAGSLQLDGQEIAGAGRDRGMVFQQYTLFPWLTVRRNVEFGLRDLGRRERTGVARHFLDLVGLGRFEDSYPGELSGGMQQRTAIARALAYKPEILLMDEPFGALDAMTRDFLHDELERIWADTGITILFVTHNVREAARLGDRVVVLSSRPGRVVGDHTVEIPRPRRIESPEVAALAAHVTDHLRQEVRRHGR
jgi:NitT/TauT family transport system ATP-binding protein